MSLKGYKILRKSNPKTFPDTKVRLRSMSYDESYTVTYRRGRMTYPYIGNGPLAVFKDLESCIDFFLEFCGSRFFNDKTMEEKRQFVVKILDFNGLRTGYGIFEVEYEEEIGCKRLYSFVGDVDFIEWERLMHMLREATDKEIEAYRTDKPIEFDPFFRTRNFPLENCPKGTVFAKGVKMIGEIL